MIDHSAHIPARDRALRVSAAAAVHGVHIYVSPLLFDFAFGHAIDPGSLSCPGPRLSLDETHASTRSTSSRESCIARYIAFPSFLPNLVNAPTMATEGC